MILDLDSQEFSVFEKVVNDLDLNWIDPHNYHVSCYKNHINIYSESDFYSERIIFTHMKICEYGAYGGYRGFVFPKSTDILTLYKVNYHTTTGHISSSNISINLMFMRKDVRRLDGLILNRIRPAIHFHELLF